MEIINLEEKKETVSQNYQVSITVLEGRHLALENIDTIVNVSIGNQSKAVRSKTSQTDSPFFNEYFVFDFDLPLSSLLEKVLCIRVFEAHRFPCEKKLIGMCKVEIAIIWSQPDHQFYHKWAVLTHPDDPTSGIKGYLQCDMCILGLGETFKQPAKHESYNIDDNLLVPAGTLNERQKARFTIGIYRGEGLETWKCLKPNERVDERVQVNPFVNVLFAQMNARTKVQKGTTVEWNEQAIFVDMFPPLFQYVYIELKDNRLPTNRNTVGVYVLDLRAVSHEGESGFLPTFGPSYVYLYGPCDSLHYTHKGLTGPKQKLNFEHAVSYKGRLLISLRTELIGYGCEIQIPEKSGVLNKTTKPLLEEGLWDYKDHFLFAVLFDVLIFDKKVSDKLISVKITHGPKFTKEKNKKQKQVIIINSRNSSPQEKPSSNSSYCYIVYPGHFPCLHILSSWPDLRQRLYNSNLIQKIIEKLNSKIETIRQQLEFENSIEVKKILNIAVKELVEGCKTFLSTAKLEFGENSLDRERGRTCKIDLKRILKDLTGVFGRKTISVNESLVRLSKYLNVLKRYVVDPQPAYPNLELWIMSDEKRLAHYNIPVQDIIHSVNLEECGKNYGKIQTFMIRAEKATFAKIEMFLWFGLDEFRSKCFNSLPRNYELTKSFKSHLPPIITYKEFHTFQCRVHIYQARISPGADKTALADPFLRVLLMGQHKETQLKEQTLNPIWDETLLFPRVTLYGPGEDIKTMVGNLVLELLDIDKHSVAELIGRGLIKPVVKLKSEKYSQPLFPPKLCWVPIYLDEKESAQVLIAAEFLELSENEVLYHMPTGKADNFTLSIPDDIRPHVVGYRLEVLFWGVRDINTNRKLILTIECSNSVLRSVLKKPKEHSNFQSEIQFLELELPEEKEYVPPLLIKLYQVGTFGRITLIGTSIVYNVQKFLCPLMAENERNHMIEKQIKIQMEINKTLKFQNKIIKESKRKMDQKARTKLLIFLEEIAYKFLTFCRRRSVKRKRSESEIPSIVKKDWWTKYHASKDTLKNKSAKQKEPIATFKIYTSELESQPEFEGFHDVLNEFQLLRGKMKSGIVREYNVAAKFKGAMKLYKWPKAPEYKTLEGLDPADGLLSKFPINESLSLTVRVYVVRAFNLTPTDINGKADAYVIVQLGKKKADTRDNVIYNELNPEFGKCFEFRARFPQDYSLLIKVMDYDSIGTDDLIGQTVVDLENRFYSKHRGTCGLQNQYEEKGYNIWRDTFLPTEILSTVCRNCRLEQPIYSKTKVKIGPYVFSNPVSGHEDTWKEIQALNTLHRWHEIPIKGFHLVPEHIETRSLYNPSKGGIEQGKIEMWVDMFATEPMNLPPIVNIEPKRAVDLELRVIVWNTLNVELKDRNFMYGERMSDIYICGWMISPTESQKTDIHYHSLHGEGNFNWRFVYRFKYFPNENKVMVIKKETTLLKEQENKIPCKLELQVWDNNTITTDAFIGSLSLDLGEMPRGAKLAKRCNLSLLDDNTPRVNLFQIKQTRGWWPFRHIKDKVSSDEDYDLTGKIELEFEVLTLEEAEERPAGKGRDEPDPLPVPKRPDISFNWIFNPLRTFRYVLCPHFGFYLCIFLLLVLVGFFIGKAIYAVPDYAVKKLLNA